jgi:magnesium-transporting ATPase (P-type)
VKEASLLRTIKFTSERKAMSVVIAMDEKHFVFVKGADSAILAKCSEQNTMAEVRRNIDRMAAKGLRVLCYAFKEIEMNGRDVESLTEQEIESDFTLIGVTGVEDKLQDKVRECIQDFRDAGISVWMLTGDQGLTAKEVGHACGLLDFSVSKPD